MRTLLATQINHFETADPIDVAIAQMLDLARRANIAFDERDGQLVMISPGADWLLWPAVRACLDEIGVDAILDYFRRTTRAERMNLSAAA
jgi:hypothetical protein